MARADCRAQARNVRKSKRTGCGLGRRAIGIRPQRWHSPRLSHAAQMTACAAPPRSVECGEPDAAHRTLTLWSRPGVPLSTSPHRESATVSRLPDRRCAGSSSLSAAHVRAPYSSAHSRVMGTAEQPMRSRTCPVRVPLSCGSVRAGTLVSALHPASAPTILHAGCSCTESASPSRSPCQASPEAAR